MTSQERKSASVADGSISSQEVFHASRSALPGTNEARRMTVTSGRRCYELFGKSSLLGSLVRTYLVSSELHSTLYWLTWKPKATKRLRLYFQLTLSAPPINATGFGLWATPNTMDGMPPKSLEALSREATVSRRGRSKPANLRDQVVSMGLWPTPRAADSEGGKATIIPGTTTRISKTGNKHGAKLADIHGSGKLNPEWVEWLMGCPTGWSDSSCLETAKSFKLLSGSAKE